MITHRSTKSGSWQDPTVWDSGVVPTRGTRAVINKGHNVELSGNCEVGIMYDRGGLGAWAQYSVTIPVGTPATITMPTNANIFAGDIVYFTTSGTLPAPLVPNTQYYVTSTNITNTKFTVSATHNGAPIATTVAGSGTHVANVNIFGDGTATLTPTPLAGNITPIINYANHPFAIGDRINLTSGTFPSGISSGSAFYIAEKDFGQNSFRITSSLNDVYNPSLYYYIATPGSNLRIGLTFRYSAGLMVNGIASMSRTEQTILNLYGSACIFGSSSAQASERHAGNIDFGNESSPIPDNLGNRIYFGNATHIQARASSPKVFTTYFDGSKGAISIYSDYSGTRSVRLAESVPIGATSFTCAKDISYTAGEQLLLEGDTTAQSAVSSEIANNWEYVTVDHVDGRTVYITSPTTKTHVKYRTVTNYNGNFKILPEDTTKDAITIHFTHQPFYYIPNSFTLNIKGIVFENCYTIDTTYMSLFSPYYASSRIRDIAVDYTVQKPFDVSTRIFEAYTRHVNIFEGIAIKPWEHENKKDNAGLIYFAASPLLKMKDVTILYTRANHKITYFNTGSCVVDIEDFHINNVTTPMNSFAFIGKAKRMSFDGNGNYFASNGASILIDSPIFFRGISSVVNRDNGYNNLTFRNPISAYGVALPFYVSIYPADGYSNIRVLGVNGDDSYQIYYTKQGYMKKNTSVYRTEGNSSLEILYN